jgi:hypothetical protein
MLVATTWQRSFMFFRRLCENEYIRVHLTVEMAPYCLREILIRQSLNKIESNLNTAFLRIHFLLAVKFCAVPLAAKLKGL